MVLLYTTILITILLLLFLCNFVLLLKVRFFILSPIYAFIGFLQLFLFSSVIYYFFATEKIDLFGLESKTDLSLFMTTTIHFALDLLIFISSVLACYFITRNKKLFRIRNQIHILHYPLAKGKY